MSVRKSPITTDVAPGSDSQIMHHRYPNLALDKPEYCLSRNLKLFATLLVTMRTKTTLDPAEVTALRDAVAPVAMKGTTTVTTVHRRPKLQSHNKVLPNIHDGKVKFLWYRQRNDDEVQNITDEKAFQHALL